MTLWTKETITGDLRDLPAGVQEIRTPEGELCRLPLPESGGRGSTAIPAPEHWGAVPSVPCRHWPGPRITPCPCWYWAS